MFDRFAQRLANHFMLTPSTIDKRFDIERLKALRATTFKGKHVFYRSGRGFLKENSSDILND